MLKVTVVGLRMTSFGWGCVNAKWSGGLGTSYLIRLTCGRGHGSFGLQAIQQTVLRRGRPRDDVVRGCIDTRVQADWYDLDDLQFGDAREGISSKRRESFLFVSVPHATVTSWDHTSVSSGLRIPPRPLPIPEENCGAVACSPLAPGMSHDRSLSVHRRFSCSRSPARTDPIDEWLHAALALSIEIFLERPLAPSAIAKSSAV